MSSSRKYERYFKPISKNKNFSSSGTIRSQGRVGQTSLSRSLVKTPFRGKEPMGTGGCCGEYNVNIVNSCCANTPSLGQSNINTRGVILSRITNPTAVFNTSCQNNCKSNVLNSGEKPIAGSTTQFGLAKDFNPLNRSHSSLIHRKKIKLMQSRWPEIDGKQGKTTGEVAKVPPVAVSNGEYLNTRFLYSNPSINCC